jgi:hypothetical protein
MALTRYDEIVQALADLQGEAKLEAIHKRILENVPERPPTKNTVAATLRNHREAQAGKAYSFVPRGKGVWKLVPNKAKMRRKVKTEEGASMGPSLVGCRTSVDINDLPSFIDQIIEPLKNEGGKLSLTIEVIYRPKIG